MSDVAVIYCRTVWLIRWILDRSGYAIYLLRAPLEEGAQSDTSLPSIGTVEIPKRCFVWITKIKCFRYGREEMLALYDKGLRPPASLSNSSCPIYSEQALPPLALIPATEEEVSYSTCFLYNEFLIATFLWSCSYYLWVYFFKKNTLSYYWLILMIL